MVLICISLMPNKVEHFFMCLLILFFSVKCPIKSFVYFSLGLPAFFLLVCRSYLLILGTCQADTFILPSEKLKLNSWWGHSMFKETL